MSMRTKKGLQSTQNQKPSSKPLPRKPRRPRRPETDRGLAPDFDLRQLAIEYLNRQRKLWPDLVKANLLPEPTEQVVDRLVEDFKHRHRTGEVDLRQIDVWVQLGLTLADQYLRYSCHNSKPTSISDQSNTNLEKAAVERRFIPWQYVFADYSVSGLIASRVGYCSFKRNLEAVYDKPG